MKYGISLLEGKTITSIRQEDKEALYFETSDGSKYKMYHSQDCCESVYLEDVCGDLDDLLNHPVILAETRTSRDNPKKHEDDSQLWTFYEIATIKGRVTLRWFGSSNGYYSESVDFIELN